MGLTPDALYSSVFSDVQYLLPFGPVGLGEIPPDATYKQFAAAHLLANVRKKFLADVSSDADDVALGKFIASNKKCNDWKLPDCSMIDHWLLCEFRKEIDDFFHPAGELLFSSYFDIVERGRVGPGAAVLSRGGSLYAKLFSSPLTTTSQDLNSVFSNYFEWYPVFSEALAERQRKYGAAKVVDGSQVRFVPKTSDCSRMICVEPSLNMFFQLGVGAILEDRLKSHFNVSLADQPFKNRRLAQIGSKSGRFATIDLSSASDSISCNMLAWALPRWFFDTLVELRSPVTEIRGKKLSLSMISSMGNGFTFPLETIIFSALVRASYRVCGVREEMLSLPEQRYKGWNWAVFGDDIIVESSTFRAVTRLIDLLGFSLNARKTFNEGPFRESCGADWFSGQPVRPVFVKKLDSLQDIMVAINTLNEWTAYTGICLRHTCQWLLSGIRTKTSSLFVPRYENADSGIKVPLSYLPSSSMVYDRNKSLLYRPFRPVPKKIKVGDGSVSTPRGVKELMWNPGGLHISFLYGELESYGISVRHGRPCYRRSSRPSPYWDWDDNADLLRNDKSDRQRWETAVYINLYNPE